MAGSVEALFEHTWSFEQNRSLFYKYKTNKKAKTLGRHQSRLYDAGFQFSN